MRIDSYYTPNSLEEAYALLADKGVIIGGGAWLKIGGRTIKKAIDIRALGLDYIKEDDKNIEIGAMTTLREIETSSVIKAYAGGVVSDTLNKIMGVGLRNIATIGGSVVSRFGFSDILTTLIVLPVKLNFYKNGQIDLADYLNKPFKGSDILVSIILEKKDIKAAYQVLKKTSLDFPVVNVAVSKVEGKYYVSVGARPSVAALAGKTMSFLDSGDTDSAVESVSGEFKFGSNGRGSDVYRKKVVKALFERCVEVVR